MGCKPSTIEEQLTEQVSSRSNDDEIKAEDLNHNQGKYSISQSDFAI